MKIQLNEQEIAVALRSWAGEAFEMVDGMRPTTIVLRETGAGVQAEITLEAFCGPAAADAGKDPS